VAATDETLRTTEPTELNVPKPAGTRHCTMVTVVHEVLAQAVELRISAEAVTSTVRKFAPSRLIEPPALGGALPVARCDMTGPSKVKRTPFPRDDVPTTPATVATSDTAPPISPPPPPLITQVSEVAEFQPLEAQEEIPSRTDWLKLETPKFRPEMTTFPPPVTAEFAGDLAVATGESNVKDAV
jgi:hypothetical protein